MNKMLNDFIKTIKKPFFIAYIIKCMTGVSICYLLYYLFPHRQFNWSVVSVLLVLSPEEFDSSKLALDRLKSNMIGASMGLLAYLAHEPNFLTLCAAVFTTIIICAFLKLGNASRSALAALAIVLIQEKERHTYISALDRMLAVVTGCLVAMLITYLYSYFYKKAFGIHSLTDESSISATANGIETGSGPAISNESGKPASAAAKQDN